MARRPLRAARAFAAAALVSSMATAAAQPTIGVPPSLTSAPDLEVADREVSVAAEELVDVTMPDLPIQWHPAVLAHLQRFRETRRGRRQIRAWLRHGQRYGAMISESLQRRGVPEDLRCVAMVESGFDPTVRSRRGAVGMWQFVARTAEEYGLQSDRFVDQRMDPVRSTDAAARFLGDLYERTGRWELALAAYNMGYPALVRAIRKYNTNDYWRLAELEAGLPFETTGYVAKIMACTVVMRNLERFGFEVDDEQPEAVEAFDVEGGVNLGRLARAARVERARLAALNPHLRRGRTPPRRTTRIYIPAGSAERFASAARRLLTDESATQPYVVRFGEGLREIAASFDTSVADLRRRNGLSAQARVRPGTTLLVPAGVTAQREPEEAPVVALPPDVPANLDGRRRVFYRVRRHDSLSELAMFFGLQRDEVRRWNALDDQANLQSGMLLQLFVRPAFDLSLAVVFREGEVQLLQTGSEAFFDDYEARQGRRRFVYLVEEGDTVRSLARRFGLSSGSIARINHIGRRSDLTPGQRVVIYCEESRVPAAYRRAGAEDAQATAGAEGDVDDRTAEDGSASDPGGRADGQSGDGAAEHSTAQDGAGAGEPTEDAPTEDAPNRTEAETPEP
ncbi:MAG: LysM peptidoglycan-binding domain-containing protein [Myxococcota bacterium]